MNQALFSKPANLTSCRHWIIHRNQHNSFENWECSFGAAIIIWYCLPFNVYLFRKQTAGLFTFESRKKKLLAQTSCTVTWQYTIMWSYVHNDIIRERGKNKNLVEIFGKDQIAVIFMVKGNIFCWRGRGLLSRQLKDIRLTIFRVLEYRIC